MPLTTDTSNSWTTLFKKVDAQYNSNAPYDGNVEHSHNSVLRGTLG